MEHEAAIKSMIASGAQSITLDALIYELIDQINHPALDFVLGIDRKRNYSLQKSDYIDDKESFKTKFNVYNA
jgi:hypothetical protein